LVSRRHTRNLEEGFEYVFMKLEGENPSEYSIILDAYRAKSGPLRRLKGGSLKTRMEEQYQYIKTEMK
jgi:hypothetical protein